MRQSGGGADHRPPPHIALEEWHGNTTALADLDTRWSLLALGQGPGPALRGAHTAALRGGDTLESLLRALGIPHCFRIISDVQGEAAALNGRAAVHLATGAPGEAEGVYRSALARARRIFSPFDEAEALKGLAASRRAIGDRVSSVRYLRQATEILGKLGVPEALSDDQRLPTTYPANRGGRRGD